MAFFDDQKKAGTAFLFFANVHVVTAAITIILGVLNGNLATETIINAIGTAISGLIFFAFAQKVRSGEYSDKLTIPTEFLHAFSYSCFVIGVAAIVAGFFNSFYFGNGLFDFAVGLIDLFIYKKINSNPEPIIDKMYWVALVVIFVLYVLSGVILFIAIINIIPLGIAIVLTGVIMLSGLFDTGVKAKFGMCRE